MASLDVIALDPTVPQLRAPAVGDTYHFCRVVEFQDGTDAAPSITNVGDTNTGIYWPNADELAVSTNGVQRLSLGATTVFNETGADVDFRIEGDTDANLVFVDASTDRVGLGLNNPDRLLDVDGSSKFRGQILITSGEALGAGLQALQLPTGVESTIGAGLSTRTGVAGESIIQFGNNMNTYYTGSVNAAKAGAMIRIDTRGVEPTPGASAYSVFQIQTRAAGVADPNYTVPVQIGAAPQGTFCIQTNGLATFNYGFVVNEGGGDYDTRFEGDTDTHLFFADASTDRIGIGTSTPGYKLDVNGTANFANNVTFTGGTANGVLYLNASKVATSGSALVFDGTNLGIGTSSPISPLTINGNDPLITLRNADVNRWQFGLENTASNRFVFYDNTAAAYRLVIDQSGNLGIGTSSPSTYGKFVTYSSGGYGAINTDGQFLSYQLLDVATAGGRFTGGSSQGYLGDIAIEQTTTGAKGGYIKFSTAPSGSNTATERMRLDSSGNLGIGTSSPANKLHVVSGTGDPIRWSYGSVNGYLSSDNSAIGIKAESGENAIFIWGTSDNKITFRTNSTERMVLDSSGNLGLGVTPSAWDVFKAVQVQQGSISSSANAANNTVVGSNVYYNAGWKYVAASARATMYQQDTGAHSWHTTGTTTGSAGGAASLTQAMTLEATGCLAIGNTGGIGSAADKVVSVEGTNSGQVQLRYNGTEGAYLYSNSSNTVLSSVQNLPLLFNTNNTERARIPAAGGMVVGTAALATNATDGFLYVPTCAGTPTGTPTTQTGTAPIVIDTTNNKLYFYSGGQWRDAGP